MAADVGSSPTRPPSTSRDELSEGLGSPPMPSPHRRWSLRVSGCPSSLSPARADQQPRKGRSPLSLAVGDRVQPLDGQSTGTLERVRTSKQGYLVAEVLWDTGARCAEPLSWLGRLEDVQAAERARQSAERKERRKHLADYQPRRCEGCAKVFTPRDKRQRFHSSRCRRQARLRVDKQEEVRGHAGGQNRVPARHKIAEVEQFMGSCRYEWIPWSPPSAATPAVRAVARSRKRRTPGHSATARSFDSNGVAIWRLLRHRPRSISPRSTAVHAKQRSSMTAHASPLPRVSLHFRSEISL
jgi:hypothetical protein